MLAGQQPMENWVSTFFQNKASKNWYVSLHLDLSDKKSNKDIQLPQTNDQKAILSILTLHYMIGASAIQQQLQQSILKVYFAAKKGTLPALREDSIVLWLGSLNNSIKSKLI